MPKTRKYFKNKNSGRNKTCRPCPIGLKPFEEEFSKKMMKNNQIMENF